MNFIARHASKFSPPRELHLAARHSEQIHSPTFIVGGLMPWSLCSPRLGLDALEL
ncbi:hypothetical protein MTR_3g040470 [Medicago truncatula]|uniref:Uncharacterized protein n=1 Tax=Medicago truncatula TaxID=3880 RepID=A0A072UWR2_MEDTR|nr:hypothetical protein MTR_3g040470 [Medicago truncatula]